MTIFKHKLRIRGRPHDSSNVLDSSNKLEDAALLCLDHQFKHTLDFASMDISEMASVSQLFLRSAEMLQDLAFSVDPCTDPRIWTLLFGYRII
jgi:hypothetical protein